MANFILVHGGWSGGWVWKHTIPALEAAGHKVYAPDLPGHGQNRQENLPNVHLKDYVECLEEIIEKCDGPVILVAHSMTGMVIAQIAEDLGKKVDKLVYAAAFMPDFKNKNMLGYMTADPWTCIGENTLVPSENGLLDINPEYARNLAFGLSSDDDFEYASAHLQLETPNMWGDEINLGDNYRKVPKYYIHSLKDNCCTYYMQRVLVAAMPVVKEYYLEADHFLMFSAADEFNNALLDIAEK